MKKNAKPQINLIRNESLKKMVAYFKNEIRECKKLWARFSFGSI